MIAGVAQIVRNVAVLGAAERELAASGHRCTFETELPSNRAKVPLLGSARTRLAMSHWTPGDPALLATELTCYDGGDPAGATCYGDGDGAITIETDDRDATIEFLRSFGARPSAGDGPLELRRPTGGRTLTIELRDGPGRAGETTLDADGIVLISFMSTGVAADIERRALTGRRRTGVWVEEVAGRHLEVGFAEGPAGELVELIRPLRQ